MGDFGDKFRKAREAKELSLDDVSNVTKISPRMLQAIEEENFDRLPGGVFNKGFIRAYAKHLGLSPEEAITEYLECLRQAQIDAQQAWEAERPAPNPPRAPAKGPTPPVKSAPTAPAKVAAVIRDRPQPSKPDNPAAKPAPQPPVQVEELPDLQLPREEDVRPAKRRFAQPSSEGIPWRLVVIAVIVVILGAVLWIRHSRAPITQSENSSAPRAASPSSSAPLAATTQTPAANAPAAVPAAPASSSGQPASPNPPVSPKPTVPVTANPAPNPAANGSIEEKNDVTIRTFGTPLAKSRNQGAASSLSLVIRATENSWLSVRADGQLVTQETLIAPANTSFHASREIVVKVGNAAGVTFLWNGKELPAQGAEAEPKTLVFDHEGMRTLAPGQTTP